MCEDFYERMMARSRSMKEMPNYKTGENYAYLGLPPNFLIFDEYVAYMEMLMTKESVVILNKLKQIVMLGRQSGFFSDFGLSKTRCEIFRRRDSRSIQLSRSFRSYE